MKVHGIVGLTFGLFCASLIFWHLSTPSNPDHVLNLGMHPILAVMFFMSIWLEPRPGVWVQISALSLGAILTGSTGSFHAAAAVGIVAMILLYAQGDFGTISTIRLIVASSAQLTNVSISAWIYGLAPIVAMGHGIAWLFGTFLLLLIFWAGFSLLAREIIKQNHDLNEANKRLLGEINERK